MSVDTEAVDLVDDTTVENIARATLFAALIGACAYVTFPNPFSPTSITLQVLIVYLAGIMLGPRWGALSLVLYLAAGAVGAPIFIGGSAGLGHLIFSQTAGYLWSYPIAAFAIGYLTHHGMDLKPLDSVSVKRLVGAMLVGTLIIYSFGVVGLMLILGISVSAAVMGGAVVFIPAELIKMAAAVGIVRSDAIRAK